MGQVKGLSGDYSPSKICSHLGISPIQIRKKLLSVQNTSLQFVEVKGKPTELDSEFLSNSNALCSVEPGFSGKDQIIEKE
ncbi:Uncharacterised protein [Legionella oakridgensis]|uniref:Uncharacterized protein n=1 Tax=Legionella longbeachae serogroup 1 (strain NSW150) TaxID=661367 RepID=D3HJ11_LEGLN|nr:hypothetical protein LLO_2007 [Legionella longbeachae NSW150]VEE02900.1 Uncharacterised protein [Legionella oakridgensis]